MQCVHTTSAAERGKAWACQDWVAASVPGPSCHVWAWKQGLHGVQVAECCIEALTEENAADTVVEVIADPAAPELSWEQLFAVAAKRVV